MSDKRRSARFIDRIASRAVAMCVRASYRDDASFMTEKYLLFCDEYLWLVFLCPHISSVRRVCKIEPLLLRGATSLSLGRQVRRRQLHRGEDG